MIELTQTNDPVLLAWLKSRLAAAGIEVHIFDSHTASLYGGALTQITQRVFVGERDIATARLILAEAERLGNAPADAGCSDRGR